MLDRNLVPSDFRLLTLTEAEAKAEAEAEAAVQREWEAKTAQ